MSNITMLDVARRAGVGIGTVSRVINDVALVRKATAYAVQKAIAEVGYTPPPGDRKRPRRTNRNTAIAPGRDVILLILGRRGLRWILDHAPIYTYVLDGIESLVTERNGGLHIRQIRDPDAITARSIGLNANTLGVIVFGDDDLSVGVSSALGQLPMVKVMGSPRYLSADLVQPDHSRSGALAAEYLLSCGHKHCAYLGVTHGSLASHVGFRCDAFKWSIEEAGGTVQLLLDSNLSLPGVDNESPNEVVIGNLIGEMLAADPRPTALLVHADMYTPSVYRHLLERGIRPQQDITIVTCNNEIPYLMSLRPAPVVIDLQGQAIGRRAVEQLYWRAQNPGQPAVRILLEPRLVQNPATMVSQASHIAANSSL